jgi:hypothetical protein
MRHFLEKQSRRQPEGLEVNVFLLNSKKIFRGQACSTINRTLILLNNTSFEQQISNLSLSPGDLVRQGQTRDHP